MDGDKDGLESVYGSIRLQTSKVISSDKAVGLFREVNEGQTKESLEETVLVA